MFKVLTEGCEPTRGSEFSACVDLYAAADIRIFPGETAIIQLGIAIDHQKLSDTIHDSQSFLSLVDMQKYESFKRSHFLSLHPRSSLRAKGLIGNTGIIDMDYQDEIKIILHNPYPLYLQDVDKPFKITKGDRIAQITLLEHKSHLFNVNTKEKRTGGFGSTNKEGK